MIYEARIKKGYTQEMLASLLGVSQASISLYEAGTRKIPADIREKLENLLKIKIPVSEMTDHIEKLHSLPKEKRKAVMHFTSYLTKG